MIVADVSKHCRCFKTFGIYSIEVACVTCNKRKSFETTIKKKSATMDLKTPEEIGQKKTEQQCSC